jgi:RIO kinase 1
LPDRTARRRRFDDDPADDQADDQLNPSRSAPAGVTPSTWAEASHGPRPFPDWVITSLDATDTDLGVLKTGKEADVHLVARELPGGPGCLMAAKRYRDAHHRMFHRDAGYTEGRRVRRSRENRAMARRTDFGRELLAGQWAAAEFAALGRLWDLAQAGAPIRVPYPVQLLGGELLLEFLGDGDGDGSGEGAAPRLAQLRPDGDELRWLWQRLVAALEVLAVAGLAHGDLSPYNVLVHRGVPVLIDLPQIVDVVVNPRGRDYLIRDVTVMSRWFADRGLAEPELRTEALIDDLLRDAGLR